MQALVHKPTDPPPDLEYALGHLQPHPHSPESYAGIPYYDEEFDVAQSPAHAKTILYLGQVLDQVAGQEGLQSINDNPVWYWDFEKNRQQVIYPDYALTRNRILTSITAKQLLLVIEVVGTSDARLERKDTTRMRRLNEQHGIPEFILVYPEETDARSVVWCDYDAEHGTYRELPGTAFPRRPSLRQSHDPRVGVGGARNEPVAARLQGACVP